MSENIESNAIERRTARDIDGGNGAQLMKQVDARNLANDDNESSEHYRRMGVSTIQNFNNVDMFRDGLNPAPREDDSLLIPNKYRKEKTKTMFGFDPINGGKVDGMPHEPSMWGSIPRIVVGAGYDIVTGTASLAVDAYGDTPRAGRIGATVNAAEAVANIEEPQWLQESAGWGEDVVRDITQFATGYAGATNVLGKMGLKSLLGKDIAASIVAGQTFDPEDGTIGTFLNEMDMLPETMQFLDAKLTTEQEGRMTGRLAMALEEVGIGMGIGAIRAANQIQKGMRARYREAGDIMMRSGIREYNAATSSVTNTQGITVGDEVIDQDAADLALHKVASGYHISNGNVDDYMRLASEAGIPDNAAKKAWNSAGREKLERLTSYMKNEPVVGE